MFELGMRLAFDKPVVIVKDENTDYSFDTGIIEHVNYPRDLRFRRMVEFKAAVAGKVASTYRKSIEAGSERNTFLRSFGEFQVATLTETTVTADALVLARLDELSAQVSRLRAQPLRWVDASSTTLTRRRVQEILSELLESSDILRSTRADIRNIVRARLPQHDLSDHLINTEVDRYFLRGSQSKLKAELVRDQPPAGE